MVSVVKTVRNTERLRQIVTVLVKHGFGELIGRLDLRALMPGRNPAASSPKSFAVRLRAALQELGPSFVKLGQIVSTRPDLIPADIITELKKLQDEVPALAREVIDEVIDDTFGGTQDELFASIDDEPLASASIAQVHRARLRRDDGDRDVVIKIQRPNIRALIERDLDLLYLLARLVERHIPESKIYSPTGLVAEFDRAIMAELDFNLEADNAARFARNFAGDASVRFPYVYREASGKRVLTMERFAGSKIYDFVAAHGGGDRNATSALHVVAKMILEHGFFHADPHPGNIIIVGTSSDPVLGLIDVGLVGRLSPELRDRSIQLMLAAVSGDSEMLADALLAMGRPRGRIDKTAFRAEVELLSERYLGKPLAEVEFAAMIRDLVQGAIKYEIDMPVEMMMVGKTLMTVEGIGKEIYPDLDVWGELKPYMVDLLRERYSPERLGRDLVRGVAQLSSTGRRLPGQLVDIVDDLRDGRLEIRASDPHLIPASDRLGRRIFTATTSGALVLAATILLAVDRHSGLAIAFLVVAGLAMSAHLWGDWKQNRD
jgi:ubiquinone biosynthesis protein